MYLRLDVTKWNGIHDVRLGLDAFCVIEPVSVAVILPKATHTYENSYHNLAYSVRFVSFCSAGRSEES